MKRSIVALLALCAGLSPVYGATDWRIETAPKYDAMCLIGILAGDSFYTRYYESELAELQSLLSEDTFAAARRSYEAFKEQKILAGPWLALAYSAVEGDTLAAAIAATEDPEDMRRGLEASQYWDEREWSVFTQVRRDLLVMFRGFAEAGFTDWWRENAQQPSLTRAAELRPRLADIDVVPMIERAVGRDLPLNRITLYAARFCRPHGIRITDDRFLLDIVDSSDPLSIAGATAIHEMIHPPFDEQDERIVRVIELLKKDTFVLRRWKEHDPAFGYNTFEGYVDENVTKALDQLIGERVGMTFMDDVEQRWLQNDEGMHVLAAAVYELMSREHFLDGNEDATEFLDRMVREKKLAPGRIESLVPESLRSASVQP
jgi:acyl carrier protein phosphodiesterase